MPFMTADNPALLLGSKKQVRRQYGVDGRVFETTGERRHGVEGEFVLGLLGVAQVQVPRTKEVLSILREVTPEGSVEQ